MGQIETHRPSLVGRGVETAAVGAFLDLTVAGFGAMVLEGEVGIGKTSVWSDGVASARERGHLVLSTRPGPAEATFSFAGLTDLIGTEIDAVQEELPTPQREALDVALLRRTAGRRAPDPRVVAAATLGTFRALAGSGPLLIAVDDMQWLDGASFAVLEFVLRRLDADPVALLATLRTTEPTGRDLTRSLDADRVRRFVVGPLSASALHHVLMSHLGASVPRPVLRRIRELSGGNPLFALEMARALTRSAGTVWMDDEVLVPESLTALVEGRLANLSSRDREVLVHVAAMARPSRRILEGLPSRLHASAALRRAIDSGVIVSEGDRIGFSHPLLSSVVSTMAPVSERRRAHRRLAAMVSDPDERAWHLALATPDPDAGVASILEVAAEQARSRGAMDAAARLSRQSLRLTSSSSEDDASRRTIQAARYLFQAGEGEEARGLLEELISASASPQVRGEAAWELARIRHEGGDFHPDVLRLFHQALAEIAPDDRRQAQILSALAWAEHPGDHDAAEEHAMAAVHAAEAAGDLGMQADSLASVGYFACLRGAPALERSAFDRALALEGHVEGLYVDERPSWVRTVTLLFHDRFDEARPRIQALIDEALERGEENALPVLRFYLSTLESWAGNWREAEEQAKRGYEDAIQTDQPMQAARLLQAAARVHALLGRSDRAREEIGRSLAQLERQGQPPTVLAHVRSVLGFVALSEGDPAGAVAELGESIQTLRRAGMRQPGVQHCAADLVEALVLCGDLEAADEEASDLEEAGRRLDSPYSRATGARCRGMLLAARGDLDGAIASFERALDEHQLLPSPFEQGRTLLALGQVQRRSKRKREARASLGQALAVFTDLGAPVWADRARGELARISGRGPAPAGLTATEERVAQLAAEGKTNREIADRLFLSQKTVEANLSRVYRKLGVRSRTELARALPSS